MSLIPNIVHALHLLAMTGECAGQPYYDDLHAATGYMVIHHAEPGFQDFTWCVLPTAEGFDGAEVLRCYLAIPVQDDTSQACGGVDLWAYWYDRRVQPATARKSLQDKPENAAPAA